MKRLICWLRGHRWGEPIPDTWNGIECTRRECERCGRSYPITLVASTPTSASLEGIDRSKTQFFQNQKFTLDERPLEDLIKREMYRIAMAPCEPPKTGGLAGLLANDKPEGE
jgi:hypothetical protein